MAREALINSMNGNHEPRITDPRVDHLINSGAIAGDSRLGLGDSESHELPSRINQHLPRKIFVTATDTGAGKTFIISKLIQELLNQGVDALAIKPVACGVADKNVNEDVEVLLHAQSFSDPNQINLYTFSQPASPHIAAAAEGESIESGQLVRWCSRKSEEVDLCLIEGVGGLMVPLNDHYLVSHWIVDMQPCEVMLIIGAKLGSINHSLLTLEKLKQMDALPKYIVINALGDDSFAAHAKNSLQPFITAQTQCFTIPHQAKNTDFQSLAESLLISPTDS